MKWGFPVISVRRAGRAGKDYWKKSGSLPGKEGSRDAADGRRDLPVMCARGKGSKKAACFVALPAAVHTVCQAVIAKCLIEHCMTGVFEALHLM